jgi:hypothetical protein
MKVKFYKGPYHGKVREYQIMDFAHPILVATIKRMRPSDYTADPLAQVPVTQHKYWVMMMEVRDATGQSYRAPAMHPDGSLFYVYGGKTNG